MLQLFAFRRSRCCAGVVFGGIRRFGHSGFGKVPPRREASRACASRRHHARRHYAHRHYRHMARAHRAGSAAWRKCRRADLRTANASLPSSAFSGGMTVRRFRLIEHRRRSAPLHRRQSDRPWQPVVRPFHEHGVAAFRLSRHRLGPGAVVRKLWPARIRTAGRRHRGDGAARRRTCRRRQRHRCPGQSDHGVGQQRQPGQGSADLARPDLRLCDADG